MIIFFSGSSYTKCHPEKEPKVSKCSVMQSFAEVKENKYGEKDRLLEHADRRRGKGKK